MLGPFTFTFTFTLESEEFEKFEKVACWISISPWWTLELLTELTNNIQQIIHNKHTMTTITSAVTKHHYYSHWLRHLPVNKTYNICTIHNTGCLKLVRGFQFLLPWRTSKNQPGPTSFWLRPGPDWDQQHLSLPRHLQFCTPCRSQIKSMTQQKGNREKQFRMK